MSIKMNIINYGFFFFRDKQLYFDAFISYVEKLFIVFIFMDEHIFYFLLKKENKDE